MQTGARNETRLSRDRNRFHSSQIHAGMTKTGFPFQNNRGNGFAPGRVLLLGPVVLVLVGLLLFGANVPCNGQGRALLGPVSAARFAVPTQTSPATSSPATSSPATSASANPDTAQRASGDRGETFSSRTARMERSSALPCVVLPVPRWADYTATLAPSQRADGPTARDHGDGASPGTSSSGGEPPPSIGIPPLRYLLLPDGDRGSVAFLSSAQVSLSTQRSVVLRL